MSLLSFFQPPEDKHALITSNKFYINVKYFVYLCVVNIKSKTMSEVELLLLDQTENCTVYTIHFLDDDLNEFEKFVAKFQEDAELDKDFRIIAKFIDQILDFGALERYFRPEGKMKDSVVAMPTLRSKLRLYGLRLSDRILILGNGGQKKTRTYDEDDTLKGYVVTLQRFEELLKEGVADGSVVITESEIETDNIFDL